MNISREQQTLSDRAGASGGLLLIFSGIALMAWAGISQPPTSELVQRELDRHFTHALITDARPELNDPRCAVFGLREMRVDMAFTSDQGRGFVCCRLDGTPSCWVSSWQLDTVVP